MDERKNLLEKVTQDIKSQYPSKTFDWNQIKKDIQTNKYQQLSDEEKEYLYNTLPKSLGLN